VKRIYIAALLSISALVFNGFSAAADTPQVEAGFNFQVLADNTAQITGCTDTCSATDLVIPATLGGVAVSKIAASAFSTGTHNLQGSLSLPESLVEVGNNAFANNSITAITFPANMVKVGTGVFSHNKLASLTIPTWMTAVPNSAFSDNPLTSLVIPEGVKTIGAKAFYNSTLLVRVLVLPKSLTKLEDQSLGAHVANPVQALFLGKAPTFPKKNYRVFSDLDPLGDEDTKYSLTYGYKNKASWAKYQPGGSCQKVKTCFWTISWVLSPESVNTPPQKPTAVWARLRIQGVPPRKDQDVYAVQLTAGGGEIYDVAKAPNKFLAESPPSDSLTFAVPPPGFLKIDLKKDPEGVYAEDKTAYFIYPDNNSNWSYFEFRPFKYTFGSNEKVIGESLVGSITLAERRKLKKYYCTFTPPRYQDLTCKTTPSKSSGRGPSGGQAGGN
jgi:hypothetical protein